MKKATLTEKKVEQTPSGGALIGKRQGQTIIHNKGTLSGYLVGRTHAEGGIKAVNKSTGQALEMQGGEVVITAPAVSDTTKNEFNGKMMTNREILSTINEKGGGVSFAKGGDVPKNIKRTGASYKYGGKTMTDHEIYKHITGGHLADGMTLSQIAKKHKVSLKELQKQVDMGMKAESEHTPSKREQMKIVKDHLFENPKYYTVLKKAGLKHGGRVHRDTLVRDSKRGNTPARDLNNYNDVLDINADGMVGAETGLFDDGGAVAVSYARGGATNVTVDSWDDIPDTFKNIRFPKAIAWSPTPDNDELYEIAKPFLSADSLKPALQGMNFDNNGITFTNSHILLTIPTTNNFYQGIYKYINIKTTQSLKTAFPEGFVKVDATYPKYENAIRKEKDNVKSFFIDILKLLTYCKVASNYSGKNEITFKINNSEMSFQPDLMINFLTSLIKLGGATFWYVNYNSSKQALIFTKYPSYELGKDIIGLIMPYIYSKRTVYGTQNDDKNAVLNVYFDFDDNVIRNADGSINNLTSKPVTSRAKRTPKTTPSQTSKLSSKVLTKDELYDSKIWIGDDVALKDKVIAKIIEMGIPYDTGYGSRDYDKNIYICIYGKDFVVWSDKKIAFDKDTRKEIFPSDLGIGSTSTATPNQQNLIEIPDKDSNFTGLISSLPEPIRLLTLQRQFEANNTPNDNLQLEDLGEDGNFTWTETPEKEEFWISINDGNFTKFKEKYGNYAEKLTGINFASTSIATATTSTNSIKSILVSDLTLKDLSDSKIWFGNNPALSEKIQKRAFALGLEWIDGDTRVSELDAPCLVFNGSGNNNNRMEKRADKTLFNNVNLKEIFVTDTTPTSVPFDLSNTKIFVGNDIQLKLKVTALANAQGFKMKTNNNTAIAFTFVKNSKGGKLVYGWNTKDSFDTEREREIFEQDLFPTSTATATPTSVPFDLKQKKIWIGYNPALSKKIQERAFELGFDWWGGDGTPKNLEFDNLFFDDNKKITSSSDRTNFDSFVSWEEITEADLFPTATASATPTSLPTFDLKRTKIWIGDNPDLSKRVQERAFELGWGIGKAIDTEKSAIFFREDKDLVCLNTSAKEFASYDTFKEIFESDLFPTSNSSQTSTLEDEMKNFDFSTLFENEKEDWVKKFTADLDKIVTYLPNDIDFAPKLSKERKDLNNLMQLLPSFQQSKYAVERAKILKEIKKLHYKLTYEGFIKPNEEMSRDANLFTPQGLLDYYFTQATQNPTADLEPACQLITPNGEKSKLPLSAYLNVRTPQFKNWFGDWEKAYETGNYVNCSKMIDPDTKEPKIYFHGVRKYVPNFGQFSNMGQGVTRPYGAFEPPSFPASYFAGEEDYAKFYGGLAENMPTPSADYKPFIYKVFLSVKNPISLLPLDFMLSYKDFMDYIYVGYGVKVDPNQELLKALNNDITSKNPMWIYVRRDIGFIEKLKDYGYDALFQMGDIPTFLPNGEVEPDRTKHLQEVEYLTFNPSQVKSATVKKSFYFDFFNDIRFKNGGYVRI